MSDLKKKIIEIVKNDLADIEAALTQNLSPDFDLVSQVADHIIFSGGKRLRPLLVILSARICNYTGEYDKKFSCVFEYLHAATLLHDDLVDGATLRRGKRVAHSIWGNPTAILVGDFLLARASSIAAEAGHLKVIKILAKITANMSQGEIRQLMRKGELDFTEEEYLDVIQRKTAIFFQGACRVGALISYAPEEKENALSVYGFNLGIAFQMADDLIDYISDTSILGKEIGADLKEGKLTMPVIYALKKANSDDRSIMERIIKNEDFSYYDFKILLEILKKYGSLTYTESMAEMYIKKAKDALSVFETSKTKDLLLMIADYAFSRDA